MNNFMLIGEQLDVLPLLLAIKRRPELWREDTYLRDYPQGPFGEVETIMLRFPEKRVFQMEADLERYKSSVDQHFCIDYPAYKVLPEARGLIMWLMSRAGGEMLGRCMINKIKLGGRIFPHADTPAHTEFYSRFHFPLETNPAVTFRAGDEQVHMLPGECWWFDNSKEHEVSNAGDGDRIHLVVDIRCSR